MNQVKDFLDMLLQNPAPILLLAIILLSASRKKKAAKKRQSSVSSGNSRNSKSFVRTEMDSETKDLSGKVHGKGHTHDRLDTDCYNPAESESEHYKKQLDSFLSSGLIEKNEYKELLRRYTGQK